MGTPSVANIVKSNALLYIAPVGTALPAKTLAAGGSWPSGWERVGYTKDVLKLAYEAEEADITVEEFLAPVGRYKTSETATIETVLAELMMDYLQLGMDGTVTDVAAGAGVPASEEIAVGNDAKKEQYMIGFEGIAYDASDNAQPIRLGLRKCTLKINGELEFSKRSDDYSGIPLQALGLVDTSTGRLIWGHRIIAPATS